jgi:hypothetical protein
MSQPTLDLRGLNPAPITPFTRDGAVDYAAIQRLGRWLAGVPGVKSLTVLGHAGEGTFLERDEQFRVIEAFRESVGDRLPIIAGITLEGTQVAAEEAKRAVKAGARTGLVYPSHGWLRFGYQKGAAQDRYKAIHEASGLPLILFQYPDATKATYDLQTQLDIAAERQRCFADRCRLRLQPVEAHGTVRARGARLQQGRRGVRDSRRPRDQRRVGGVELLRRAAFDRVRGGPAARLLA